MSRGHVQALKLPKTLKQSQQALGWAPEHSHTQEVNVCLILIPPSLKRMQ